MKLSIKSLQDLAKSPKGRQLLQQAKKMDTPENRKKAQELVRKLRNGKKRAA